MAAPAIVMPDVETRTLSDVDFSLRLCYARVLEYGMEGKQHEVERERSVMDRLLLERRRITHPVMKGN